MSTPSFGRLWRPNHGIVFTPTRPEENSQPQVDMLRSLHTTPRPNIQTATAANIEDDYLHSENEDAAFSTAPEFQSESEEDIPADATDADIREAKMTEVEASAVPADPLVTSLEFKISPEAFRNAQNAALDSPESFWSYTMYRGPAEDGGEQKVKVHYCRSKHTMERVCKYFVDDEVLGLDLEWSSEARKQSGPRKNVSLIQIANQSRIALFHVSLFPEDDLVMSPTFRSIMENRDVLKVGVAIKGDCTRLRNHLAVDTKGIFELSHLYKLVKHSRDGRTDLINKRLVTLAQQVEEHLGLPMFKEQNVRTSDWSQPLNMAQVMYSASDAYAGFHLFHVLEGKRQNLDPVPPRPHRAECDLPIQFASGASIPTAGENTEDMEEEDVTTTSPSASQCRDVRESIFFEPEVEGQSVPESGHNVPATTPKKRQKDPRVEAANVQLASYRASIKSLRAAQCAVRSYFIWRENNDLDPDGIAKILRDSPLQPRTVANYILEAIRLEKLPFDKERLKAEVLCRLPSGVVQTKYKRLAQETNTPDA